MTPTTIPDKEPEETDADANWVNPELPEEVFACPVFNRYGCREVSVIAPVNAMSTQVSM